jgi:hypothetical protein
MTLTPLKESHYNARGKRRTSVTQAHAANIYPAPVKGLDYTQTLVAADPNSAITLENLIPRKWGSELRKGYSHWIGGLDGEVRTLMSYISVRRGGEDKLFACTSGAKIYDVSATSFLTPTELITHLPGDFPGEWHWINFAAGDNSYLLAVSQGVGYYVYDGTDFKAVAFGTEPGMIDGIDPLSIAYIFQWKSIVWFLKKDSAIAYYLPGGQIYGTVQEFDFGPFLEHGGPLWIGYNWTVDAGNGLDDKLALFSQEGDVLIYGGYDPNTVQTFQKESAHYLGHLPIGRRCVARFASDLVILSERGLCFLSELLRGQGLFLNSEVGQRVNAVIADDVSSKINSRYWEICFLPHEQLMLLNTPTLSAVDTQWAFEVNAKGFCTLTKMPMLTVISHDRKAFFGDTNGNVWLAFDGSSDGSRLTVDGLLRGADLEGIVMTAFLPHGEPVRLKRFQMVRPMFLAPEAPAIKVLMNSDWAFGSPRGSPVFSPPAGASLWNTAIWNQSVWSGTERSYGVWVGVEGMGYYGALAMRVRGAPGTTFVSWQAVTTPGGIL